MSAENNNEGNENNVNGVENKENSEIEPALYNHKLTEEQKQRKIKCVTFDDKIVEVEWHLLMQCGTFVLLWDSLNLEESASDEALECFHFPLNEITEECIIKVADWMRMHQGMGPLEIKYDQITTERKWFPMTDWEKSFFEIDFEFLKEIYLASNFLDLKSLYYYCAQECARCIMDKSAEEIREMLCLPDDLTEEEKAQIAAEYEYRETPPPAPAPEEIMDESEMQGTSAQFMQQSSSKVIYENYNGAGSSSSSGGGGSGGSSSQQQSSSSSSVVIKEEEGGENGKNIKEEIKVEIKEEAKEN